MNVNARAVMSLAMLLLTKLLRYLNKLSQLIYNRLKSQLIRYDPNIAADTPNQSLMLSVKKGLNVLTDWIFCTT